MEKYGLDELQFKKLKELVYSHLELDREVDPESVSQDNLDTWDSSRHLSLIMELESIFKVSFKIDEVTGMRSFEDIVYYLSKKGV